MILFIDGEWQIVFVDDYLPYDPSQEELVGVRPKHNELWAILLEKAWIKINGGYTNTFGGLFSEAISALTGFPTEIFKHNKNGERIDIFRLYKNIEIGYQKGSIMACGTNPDGIGINSGSFLFNCSSTKMGRKKYIFIKIKKSMGTK